MKKTFIRLSVAAALVASVSAANAESFQTLSGTSFTKSFTFNPDADNSFVFSVSGLADYYSALSFQIVGQVPTITATNKNGNLVAAFNDIRNSNYFLLGGQNYTVTVSGTTKSNVLGGYGIVSLTSANGTVSPVPEPESYAMFLAGLGLMGAIARRRSSKRAA